MNTQNILSECCWLCKSFSELLPKKIELKNYKITTLLALHANAPLLPSCYLPTSLSIHLLLSMSPPATSPINISPSSMAHFLMSQCPHSATSSFFATSHFLMLR